MSNELRTEKKHGLPSTFCPNAWMQICGSGVADLVVCGEGNEKSRGTPLSNFFNSPKVLELRRALAAGEKPSHCSSCWFQEGESRRSTRMHALQAFTNALGEESLKIALAESARNEFRVKGPKKIDLKLGNNCNLACRMCSPTNSAKMWSEYLENKELLGSFSYFYDFAYDAYNNPIPQPTVEEWLAVSDDVEFINISGGEPCMLKGVQDYLEAFDKKGFSKKTLLSFNTNGTYANWPLFETIKKYKRVLFCISVDGTDSSYEYIRFPAKWENSRDSILKIRDGFKNSPNVEIFVSPTYQILNILNLTDIYRWCDSEGLEWVVDSFVTDPPFLSVSLLPNDIRDLAADRLEEYQQSKNNLTGLQEFGIKAALKHLRFKKEFDSNKFQEFVTHTKAMDQIRSQRFSDFCPELYELLIERNLF